MEKCKEVLKKVEPQLMNHFSTQDAKPILFDGGFIYKRITRTTTSTDEQALTDYLKASLPDIWNAVKKETVDTSRFQAFLSGGLIDEKELIDKGIVSKKKSYGLVVKNIEKGEN